MLIPYLMALPYVTFVPVYGFLGFFLRNSNVTKDKRIFEGKQAKVKKFLAGSIFIIMTFGWMILMMIIAANQGIEEKILLVLQFIQILGQDILISPILSLLLQYCCYLLLKKAQRKGKIQKFFMSLLSYSFRELMIRGGHRNLSNILKRRKKANTIYKQ